MFEASQAVHLATVPAANENMGDSRSRQYTSAPSQGSGVDWQALVDGVQKGDAAAMEDLYRLFSRGLRFYICRHLGVQDLDDRVHDAFIVVVEAIQRGALREPERLMGFVRTIARRQVAGHIDSAIRQRKEEVDLEIGAHVADGRTNPESSAFERQRAELMKQVLRSLPVKDREILTRYYLYEQTQEQICRDMSLNKTQFRLLKSRAKARFGDFGRRSMRKRSLYSIVASGPSPSFSEFAKVTPRVERVA